MKSFAIAVIVTACPVSATTCRKLKETIETECCDGNAKGDKQVTLTCPSQADTSVSEQLEQCKCIGTTLAQMRDDFTLSAFGALTGKDYEKAWATFMNTSGYAGDYGLDCGKHDAVTPTCMKGGKDAGAAWCQERWCYMTSSKCPGATSTSWFKGTMMEKYLFFSYPKCGGNDTFSRRLQDADRRLNQGTNKVTTCDALKKAYDDSNCCNTKVPEQNVTAHPCSCQCVGAALTVGATGFVHSLFGQMLSLDFSTAWSSFMTDKGYTSKYGLECGNHDDGVKGCAKDGASYGENWCKQPWCYLTNANCPGTYATSFFKGTTLEKSLHYSYPQCNGIDYFNTPANSSQCSTVCKTEEDSSAAFRVLAGGLVLGLVMAAANL